MRAHLTTFATGWSNLSLELSAREIDDLIVRLEVLKGVAGHFHFVSDFSGEPGVGDIEVSCSGDFESTDLVLM